jgi:predicted ATPase
MATALWSIRRSNYRIRAQRDELVAALGRNASTIARIAPALRERLGDIPEPASLDKEEERFRLLDAVTQFLISVAQKAPLVLVLDDLHWADRGTVGLLGHMAHNVTSNPILLIGAYRDAEVDRMDPLTRAVAAIRRLPNFETLSLKGLKSGDLAELLSDIADQDAPQALVETLAGDRGQSAVHPRGAAASVGRRQNSEQRTRLGVEVQQVYDRLHPQPFTRPRSDHAFSSTNKCRLRDGILNRAA